MNKNYFLVGGFVIYLLLTIVDRLIAELPDYIYIIISLIAIVLVIIGIITDKKNIK